MTTFLSIEALAALSTQAQALVGGGAPAATLPQPGVPLTGGFGELVSKGVGQLNRQLLGSQVELQKLALGEAQNLHQIMINLEESRVSFQLMMQVRSRLLEAYQDIMKMPL